MYRITCKSHDIEAACRKPSCVYPGICPNRITSYNVCYTKLLRLLQRCQPQRKVKLVAGSGTHAFHVDPFIVGTHTYKNGFVFLVEVGAKTGKRALCQQREVLTGTLQQGPLVSYNFV